MLVDKNDSLYRIKTQTENISNLIQISKEDTVQEENEDESIKISEGL